MPSVPFKRALGRHEPGLAAIEPLAGRSKTSLTRGPLHRHSGDESSVRRVDSVLGQDVIDMSFQKIMTQLVADAISKRDYLLR